MIRPSEVHGGLTMELQSKTVSLFFLFVSFFLLRRLPLIRKMPLQVKEGKAILSQVKKDYQVY